MSKDDLELSELVMQYWGNFAHHGDPNAEGLMTWPEFRQDTDEIIVLSRPSRVDKFKETNCDWWENFIGYDF